MSSGGKNSGFPPQGQPENSDDDDVQPVKYGTKKNKAEDIKN